MRYFLCAAMMCSLYPVLARPVRGQQQDDQRNLQKDVKQLRTEVKALEQGQQRILDELKEMKKLLETKSEGAAPPQQPQVVTLNVHGEAFMGDPAARVAIVEYSDFECPFCGQYSRDIYPQLIADYVKTGKVRYYFRDLPLPMHPHALIAARAARCAGEQGKFWEMHDSLFANQGSLEAKDLTARAASLGLDKEKFADCFSSQKYTDNIRRSAAGAVTAGINATPSFAIGLVTPNGDVIRASQLIQGAQSYDEFKFVLGELLATK